MLRSQALRRTRRFQAMAHTFAGLGLLDVALREEQGGGVLPWVAGVAAVLLLGLVGWEQLQPGAQPVAAEIAAELLGMAVLVAEGREKLHLGARFWAFAYFVAAAVLGVAMVLHRARHRAAHAAGAEKGARG
ncbi:MAG TPA: hypothetical protein VLT82_15375 [Myxococcaceae bacterium]|nr:hypothetical protein [Myxococcaceae bacterium]